jgi:hypothetical protein
VPPRRRGRQNSKTQCSSRTSCRSPLVVRDWAGPWSCHGPLWHGSTGASGPGARRHTAGGTVPAAPLRPLAPAAVPAVPWCHRSTPPRRRPSDKWQTRREAGTQSHGPLRGSRVAEQEVDLGGPEIPGSTACRAIGHHPGGSGRGVAQRSIQLPPLRFGGRRVNSMTGGRSLSLSSGDVEITPNRTLPFLPPAPCAPRTRASAPRGPSTAGRASR